MLRQPGRFWKELPNLWQEKATSIRLGESWPAETRREKPCQASSSTREYAQSGIGKLYWLSLTLSTVPRFAHLKVHRPPRKINGKYAAGNRRFEKAACQEWARKRRHLWWRLCVRVGFKFDLGHGHVDRKTTDRCSFSNLIYYCWRCPAADSVETLRTWQWAQDAEAYAKSARGAPATDSAPSLD